MIAVFFTTCKKDLLKDDLADLNGKFEWQYNQYTELVGLHYESKTRYPSSDGFTASLEFGDKNKITFFIDGKELVKKSFKIKEKETVDSKLRLVIKVDVSKKTLDIDDELELLYWDDTLIVNRFPHRGYSGTAYGQNFFVKQ